MPCAYYSVGEESAVTAAVLDKLTHENDILREMVLKLESGGRLTHEELELVKPAQIEHRKEDLERLRVVFTRSKDATRLGKVMLANPKSPLAPQLGFDPNDF